MFGTLAENWILKLISLVFAVVLWFFVMGEQRQEVGFTVPLRLSNIPEGLMVANEVPNLIDVRISGPRTLLMNLSPQDISIAVDLSDLKPGLTSFKRLDERLNIPSALRVTRLSPSFVDVKLERVREKTVPIKVPLEGTLPEGYKLIKLTYEPKELLVTGAESELKSVNEVATEPVSLENVQETFTEMVPVVYRGIYTGLKEPVAVEVEVTIEAPPPPPEPEQEPGPEANPAPQPTVKPKPKGSAAPK